MKIYSHLDVEHFSNSYLVVNEETQLAVVIDPGKITKEIIEQIEGGGYGLCAALLTQNRPGSLRGISTLRKIYNMDVYAADTAEVAGAETIVIKGDGVIKVAGLDIVYFALPGYTVGSMVYKVGTVLFTGDSLTAGAIGETTSSYARMTLINGIRSKLLSFPDGTVIMPGHGPLTSVGAERLYNIDLNPLPKNLSDETVR